MRRCFRYGLIVLTGQLAGCYGAYDAPTSEAQPLNGTAVFPADSGCNNDQMSAIALALGALRQHVVTSPSAMLACTRNAVLAPHQGAFAEQVMARLAEAMSTTFRCRQLGTTASGAAINAQASGVGTSNESMTVDTDLLTQDTARIAAVILHTLAYNKGYTTQDGTEYDYSINEQVESCVESLIRTGTATPRHRSRADMKGEVELQRIGGSGGGFFERFCAGSSFVSGMRTTFATGTLGPGFAAFGLGCREQGSASSTNADLYGAPNTVDACAADQVVIGLKAYADSGEYGRVNRMAFVCARWSDVAAGTIGLTTTMPNRGQASGRSVERICPPGSALKGVAGRWSGDGLLNELRPVCRSLSGVALGSPNTLDRLGNEVQLGSNRRHVRELCTDTGALVGLYGRADGTINRLGGICTGMRTAVGLLHPYGVSSATHAHEHILQAAGGTGGNEVSARCPNGQVLVGLRAGLGYWGDAISHVAGVCALSHPWARTSDPVTLTTLGTFGNDRGNGTTLLCPRGELLTGLSMSEVTRVDGVRVVENVRPVCRRIDQAPTP